MLAKHLRSEILIVNTIKGTNMQVKLNELISFLGKFENVTYFSNSEITCFLTFLNKWTYLHFRY